MSVVYRTPDLEAFGTRLLEAAGLEPERAVTTARLLLEADLMGHSTHGLAQCGPYLDELVAGRLRKQGEPEVLSDNQVVTTWDGNRLPGVWLTHKAVSQALERARQTGMAACAIRRSGHIGCLATFLPAATDQGCLILIASSDPSVRSVAPFGGVTAQLTPNPLAVGIPTDGDPILIDISASITTNGMVARHAAEGRPMPGNWLLDADGQVTDDPLVLTATPPGSILPVGGADHGHKGFALALFIEALTQGLAGFGRVDQPTEWGAAVFVQVMAPSRFGGEQEFRRVMGFLADSCRATPAGPAGQAVRLPGQRGLELRARQLRDGVALYPGIMEELERWAKKLQVAAPAPL